MMAEFEYAATSEMKDNPPGRVALEQLGQSVEDLEKTALRVRERFSGGMVHPGTDEAEEVTAVGELRSDLRMQIEALSRRVNESVATLGQVCDRYEF